MEILPQSLSYSASKQALRMNRFQCRPAGADTATPGSTVRINLPSKSLVNLSSFNLCFNLTMSGMTTHAGNNFSNAKLPHGHKLFSAVRVMVGNQMVSGGLSNHYDVLYNSLVKASCGEDWVNSRLNEHTKELIENADDMNKLSQNVGDAGNGGVGASKVARYVIGDFLGAFRGNGGKSIIDTSLWGDIAIEFTFNSSACIAKRAGTGFGGGQPAVTYSVADIEGYVECITQTTPLYIKLITMLLDDKQAQIRFPYQNFITGLTNTGKSARLQINSNCIDAMVLCPLGANANSLTQPLASGELSAPRYKYTALNADGSAVLTIDNAVSTSTTTNIQIQIGSDTFPKVPITNALDVSDITQNSLFSNSLYSQNLLFNGITSSSTAYDATTVSTYSRQKFLSENFVYVQSFADGEGWSSKILTGIDSASQNLDVIVNFPISSTAGSSLFIGALVTSLLVFDCRTGQVSVIQ
jgi:hypothetical protein